MDLEKSINLAIENTVLDGIDDVFDRPFELNLLTDPACRERVFDHVRRSLTSGCVEGEVEALSHVLVPKGRREFDYRRVAVIHPLCHLKYLALCIQAAPIIERHRVPVEDRVVFSYRFRPHSGRLFSEDYGYRAWKEEIVTRKGSRRCEIVVHCDIASFYDRLNLHRLESTLQAIGVPKAVVRSLNGLLTRWSGKDSYGLPIGGNGSRILAEAAFIDIDRRLREEGVDFVRFVDDYRLFAPDLVTAQRWVGCLIRRLSRDGLTLNAAKTSVRPAETETKDEFDEQSPLKSADRVLEEIVVPGGYRRLARRYRQPTAERFEILRRAPIDEDVKKFDDAPKIDFEIVQRVLLTALAKERYDVLQDCCHWVKRCIGALEYTVDLLLKNGEMVPANARRKISAEFACLLESDLLSGFEWYQERVTKLLASPQFFARGALLVHGRSQPAASSLSVARALERVPVSEWSREDVLQLRETYERQDAWQRRRTARIVAERLPRDEARAWFRANRRDMESDPLMASLEPR